MKLSWGIILLFLLNIWSCADPDPVSEIQIWYGDHQFYGRYGISQKWVNILGNVSDPEQIQSLSYRLNDESPISLNMGPDGRRLAREGDFNIDIDTALLHNGENIVRVSAVVESRDTLSKEIVVGYNPENIWPLPYTMDWQKTDHIADAVQIVDGKWEITEQGVRTVEPYYDRVLAIGDDTWKDYEVTTSVIFHNFTPPQKGPPTFNVSHAAIATRWPGHDLDDKQPHVKWYPLGATAEFRLTTHLDSCRWRIFDGENLYAEDTLSIRTIELDTRYNMKHRVESISEGRTLYSVKLWDSRQPEPKAWDLQAREPPGNIPSGSALLLAHNTDVTFGNIEVIPLNIK